MHLYISCAGGLDSVLKKEIEIQNYKIIEKKSNLIGFEGDFTAIAKLNLRSRVGNKVYIQLGKGKTETFDQLFDLIQDIDRSYYVPKNSPIIVTASSKNSLLTSTPAIQSIGKKSIVKKLLNGDGTREETNTEKPIEIGIHIEENACLILLNTSGAALHKRGYRKATGDAPINESLAAGLILLSGWRFSQPLYDPFCGSGTLAIEAALIAKNIAPGLNRSFSFQYFDRYDQSLFDQEKKLTQEKIMTDKEHTIIASDIDPEMIKIAQNNAKNAGVEKYITFETRAIKDFPKKIEAGALVCNPPYGIRMQPIDLENIYTELIEIFRDNEKLNGGFITTYEQFNRTGFKRIQFYNGGEKCRFFKRQIL